MLLIGDIHITQKYSDAILTALRNFVNIYPNEKSVIFVGDYVYHFSYDRKALLQLFGFFLELVQQGKDVYVMSGNHDRIQEHFVYAESQKAFQVFQSYGVHTGKLEFITEPCWREIDEKKVFFLPFTLLPDQERGGSFDMLLESSNKQEQQSGRVNTIVERELQIINPLSSSFDKENKDTIYMIHHRYIADQVFPGQQTRFSYKSPALSAQWLDMPGLKMISGHLHQPFSYKNYLCLGSVWHTSPLEYNQNKFCFCLSSNGIVQAQELIVHPYIHGSLEQITKQDSLYQYLGVLYSKNCKSFSSDQWSIEQSPFQEPELSCLSVIIRDNNLSYDSLQSLLDPIVFNSIMDISIKKETMQMEQFVALLEIGSQQLTESIADRKTLLLQYIQQKYGDRSEIYENELRNLKLI